MTSTAQIDIPFVDVAIVGGGPGGLALAQGLRKNGIESAVFERDHVRADYVQGFRLAIRQRAIDALQANLPPHLFEAFLATTGKSPGKSIFVDENFEPVEGPEYAVRRPEDDGHRDKSLSRITLRQILLSELGDIFRPGKKFERYERQLDGTVVAYFTDGSAVRANVLVGADGINSAVRKQLLPHFKIFDVGVRRLAGKITFEEAARRGFSPLYQDYNVSVRPRAGHNIMISGHRVDPKAYARYVLIGSDDATHKNIAGFHFDNTTSWWNTAYKVGELGPDSVLETLGGAELLNVLLQRIGHWDARILDLIRHTDPSTVAFLKVRSSEPGAVWETGSVTLLGDAIHAMTYFRALGGNSAIYDAGLLAAELTTARRHGKPPLTALRDYEDAMRAHGYEAVRASLTALQNNIAADRAPQPVTSAA